MCRLRMTWTWKSASLGGSKPKVRRSTAVWCRQSNLLGPPWFSISCAFRSGMRCRSTARGPDSRESPHPSRLGCRASWALTLRDSLTMKLRFTSCCAHREDERDGDAEPARLGGEAPRQIPGNSPKQMCLEPRLGSPAHGSNARVPQFSVHFSHSRL